MSNLINASTLSNELNGPVKELKQSQYKAFSKFGRVYLGSPIKEDYTVQMKHRKFNIDGLMTEETNYYDYSSYNRRVIGVDRKSIHTYQKISNTIETLMLIELFNDKGVLMETIFFDEKEAVTRKQKNKYDEKEQLVEAIYYDKNDIVTEKTFLTYDEDGFKTEFKNINQNGEVTYWQKYKKNLKGHNIEILTLDNSGKIKSVNSYHHLYDALGNPIRQRVKDNLKEELYYSVYEYDHHKNWTKKVNYYNEKAMTVSLREFIYYGENEEVALDLTYSKFDVPLYLKNGVAKSSEENDINQIQRYVDNNVFNEKLDLESAKWLSEKVTSIDNFPILNYYALLYKDYPSQITFGSSDIEAFAFLHLAQEELNAQVIFDNYFHTRSDTKRLMKYVLEFPDYPGYLLQSNHINQYDEDSFEVPDSLELNNDFDGLLYLGQFTLLRPSLASNKRDEYFEEELENIMIRCTLTKRPEKPEIYMVESGKNGYSLQPYPVRDNFTIRDLELHYGLGFDVFHQELMSRFKSESKGLVLFHGLPGTGKTFYIRHLLKEISEANKIVIYMPPNMVDYLINPDFMTFLSGEVQDYNSDGKFCVLLIEDAEPLLAARNSETRIQGVTNLLNMTDGLLNDMLKLQIICTFNVELNKLDDALLRPGRLIARKEFKPLSELDANLLGQSLGLKYHFTEPATLSEIYSKLNDKHTILHDEY